MAAAHSGEDLLLELVFDRAVSIAAFDGSAIVVDDAVELGLRLDGQGGAVLLDPVTLHVTLVAIGDPTGPGVTLTASAMSGIAAVDDGGTWAGVADLALPFP